MTKLRDYLRISEAAEYLGVSANTLRNWGAAGKITVHRNPVNQYRLFKKADLDALLTQADLTEDITRSSTYTIPTKPR